MQKQGDMVTYMVGLEQCDHGPKRGWHHFEQGDMVTYMVGLEQCDHGPNRR
jgi:hypothetical protein